MNSLGEEIKRRKLLADFYYDNAAEHYRKGERSKASEFLWGSINSITYALGLLYGRKLTDHGKIIAFLRELADGLKSEDMLDWIDAANSIHANFYHDFMDEIQFERSWRKTEILLIELIKLLEDEISRRGIRI